MVRREISLPDPALFVKRPSRRRTERVLLFIAAWIDANGFAPTLREIGEGLGINSTSVARYHIRKLADADLLDIHDGVARAIVVTAKGERLVYETLNAERARIAA